MVGCVILLWHTVNHHKGLWDSPVPLPDRDVIGQGGHGLSHLAKLTLEWRQRLLTPPQHQRSVKLMMHINCV